jgi:acetyl esterase
MKSFFRSTVLLILGCLATDLIAQDISTLDSSARQKLLKRFPEADLDKDGTLSQTEVIKFAKTKRKGESTPSGSDSTADGANPRPTFTDVSYGPDERNKLDLWKAKSDEPTPLVVYIHGGGFVSGDKSMASKDRILAECLANNVSYAAINYRYRTMVPIQDVLRDCARAVQFMRSKSLEWNVDKTRVACFGGSAGAGTSMWLAFHDDLADPNSPDPVLRESTRISCAGSNSGQFSYDIVKWVDAFGEENANRFGDRQKPNEFYGLKSIEELEQPHGVKIRADCDMCGLITKDDAPVFLACSRSGGPINDKGAYLHHPKHSQLVYDRCREVGVVAVADLPGLNIHPASDAPKTLQAFLFKHLKVEPK